MLGSGLGTDLAERGNGGHPLLHIGGMELLDEERGIRFLGAFRQCPAELNSQIVVFAERDRPKQRAAKASKFFLLHRDENGLQQAAALPLGVAKNLLGPPADFKVGVFRRFLQHGDYPRRPAKQLARGGFPLGITIIAQLGDKLAQQLAFSRRRVERDQVGGDGFLGRGDFKLLQELEVRGECQGVLSDGWHYQEKRRPDTSL